MHLGKLVTACCLTAAALSAPATLSASAAPQFRLRDTAGGVHTFQEWRGGKAVVLFFVATDCPVANSYVPEMNRIFTHDGRRLYLGRIDNRVEDFGKQRYRATVADLRQALDAILAGEQPPHATTHSLGCATTRLPEGTR